MDGNVHPIRRKSMVWWRHGKHAQVDPWFIRDDRRPPPRTEMMFPSVAAAFAASRAKKGR